MTVRREDVKVKRSSAGLGLFALRPVPAGRRIIEFAGRVVPAEEARGKAGVDRPKLRQKPLPAMTEGEAAKFIEAARTDPNGVMLTL